MMSSIASSMMARRPRAPELRRIASRAMARSASLVKVSFTFSISKSFWYCFTSAFFGCGEDGDRSSSFRSLSVATTGRRPTNSGIIPNFIRSSGSTSASSSPTLRSSRWVIFAPKPRPFSPTRRLMTPSMPWNAPPQMNRMFVVSTCTYSCWLYFLPPRGVTLARVPSMIFKSACCTPSPPTSRVALGRVALARDLVDLVDVDDAARRLLHVVVGVVEQVLDDVLHVLTHVAGLGEAGGVRDGEGNVEEARQRLRQQRLAATRGADEQDVALAAAPRPPSPGLHPRTRPRRRLLLVDALVVVVDGDREDLLRLVLTDDVVVEERLDLHRRGQARPAACPPRARSPPR